MVGTASELAVISHHSHTTQPRLGRSGGWGREGGRPLIGRLALWLAPCGASAAERQGVEAERWSTANHPDLCCSWRAFGVDSRLFLDVLHSIHSHQRETFLFFYASATGGYSLLPSAEHTVIRAREVCRSSLVSMTVNQNKPLSGPSGLQTRICKVLSATAFLRYELP